MNILKNKTQTKKQSRLSAEEAHRLWAKTQARYIIINNIHLFSNYVHDIDFKMVLDSLLETYVKQANIMEKQLHKYSIKSPEPSKIDIEASGNSNVVSDQDIALTIYSMMQLILGKCMKSLRDTTFNDDVRELLIYITREDVVKLFEFVNYMDDKGWIEYPPLFPSARGNAMIGANEVWELWAHLYNRYLSIQQTKIFASYAYDVDLQALFALGTEILKKQAEKIERVLLKYGVNLPDRQPENVPTPESKERLDDKYMFQLVLNGMENATILYGFAIQELVINKDIQQLFKELIFDEMGYIDKMLKYGKVKGWVPLVPVYKP